MKVEVLFSWVIIKLRMSQAHIL